MRGRPLPALLALAVFWPAMAATAEGDPERGLKLAIDNCARCHVIGDYNPYGGINSTPSFWIFARKQSLYMERLSTFDQRRPHRSMTFHVKPRDIEDIKAYVRTLKVE